MTELAVVREEKPHRMMISGPPEGQKMDAEGVAAVPLEEEEADVNEVSKG